MHIAHQLQVLLVALTFCFGLFVFLVLFLFVILCGLDSRLSKFRKPKRPVNRSGQWEFNDNSPVETRPPDYR